MKKMTLPKKGFFIGLFVILSIVVASISFTTYTASVRKSQKMEGEEISGSDVTECANDVTTVGSDGKKQSVAFVSRYDVRVDMEGNNIKIYEGEDSDSSVRNVKLYLETAKLVEYIDDTNDNDDKFNSYFEFSFRNFSSTDYVFNYKNPTYIPDSLVSDLQEKAKSNAAAVGREADSVLFTFRSVNPKDDPLCVGSITFDVAIDLTSFAKPEFEQVPEVKLEEVTSIDPTSSINCNNPQTEFEKSYCSSTSPFPDPGVHRLPEKDYTKEFGLDSDTKDEMSDNDVVSLKCNVEDLVNYNSSVLDTENESKYFVNEAILTASSSYSSSEFTDTGYVYHYAPKGIGADAGSYGYSTPLSVTVDCTERVKVQYGPPVAATAGLCFEYNVKVTSTVTCKARKIEKPKPPTVCTPVPECYHPAGDWTGPAAGPNDNFDQCVKNCDGGKYTLSCSEKCYKSVYGSDASKTSSFSSQLKGTKVADFVEAATGGDLDKCVKTEEAGTNYFFDKYHSASTQYFGCYYWSGNDIEWYGGNVGVIETDTSGTKQKNTRYTPGRWYMLHRKTSDLSKFESNNDGFLRKKFANNLCTATCKWTGCTKDQYLNPAVARADYAANIAEYNKALEFAKKVTTCSERTAEFKVEITKNGQSVYNLDNFSDADKLYSKKTGYSVSAAEKLTNKNFLRDYDGCYQSSDAANEKGEWYKAVWSFPGTWIDVNKTQAITYTPHSDYLHIPYKFCLPYKLEPVNEKFWRYYYTKYKDDKAMSFNDENYEKVCPCEPQYVESVSESDVVDWNIHATTLKFGRFKWNIDISCFYSYAKSLTICEDPKCEKNSDDLIRTVDLKDLFPVSGNDGGTHSDSVAGRTPGFNWDKFAKNDKDSAYESDPVAYMKWVQQTGDKIWDDDLEVDYDIRLTRKDINYIRKKSSENGFKITNYDFVENGQVNASNVKSVTNYKSNLIRNELENKGTNKVPEDNLLYCNNIFQSRECLSYNNIEGAGD